MIANPRQARDKAAAQRIGGHRIGIACVARRAAGTALPTVTITSTLSRTNSAAMST